MQFHLKAITNTSLVKYTPLIVALVIGIAVKDPLQKMYNKIRAQTHIDIEDQLALLLEQGIEAHRHGNTKESIKFFQQALRSNQHLSRGLLRLGNAYALENNHELAIHYYKSALDLEPRHLTAYVALGMSLARVDKKEEAINYFKTALASSPTYFDACFQLSKVEMDLHQFDKALEHAHKAMELQPNNIHVYLNLGHIHNKQGTLDDAVAMYQKALTIDPNFANAHYNLGYTLRLQKKTEQALVHLHKSSELQKDYIDAHVALAQAYWAQGNFEIAWQEYEWRWRMLGINPSAMDVPLWDGSDLKGKKILLYSEQGLGDTLQFIRLTKLVKERGATIICKVQKPLMSLLTKFPHIDTLVSTVENVGKIDYQAPLLNLPGILKIRANTIPAEIPYLKADPKLVQWWHNKLAHDKNFKIGLCWHVDPEHEVDKSPWSKRSVNVELFKSLSTIPGVSFYSLQKINGEEQLKNLPDSFVVHTFGPNFDEGHGRFMDTAAVIQNLDLIVTVDTSIAHVAGALGKKVWMLLPYSPDCRWYDQGNTTAWYPTMRLFRQPKPYDWQTVSKELATALQETMKKV